MFKRLLLLAALLAPLPAVAQSSVQYVSPVTRGHVPIWNTNGVIADGGSSADSPITSLGVTNNGGNGFCVNSGRITSPGYQALCLGANTIGPGIISLQNYGTATAQNLEFIINGTPVIIPTGGNNFLIQSGTPVSGHVPCYSGTIGLVVDCGTSIGAGTQFGLPYYSTSSSLGSTGAGVNGQFLLGQTSSVPLWTSLSGDVSSVSAAGLLTLGKVNGIPFGTTYAANGVLIGEGTNQFHSISTLNIGQCLLSQGASDPTWASCASGSGSAGGSNTQVQFNNSTALAGSANFTWVSPALTLGLAGSVTGQLALAPAGSGSGTVTIQNPSTTSAYNFNLPTTAGSLGQPLLSGGGGSTAMSFGTLGIVGGGTNCVTASGTCVDNISGFSSTGFISRTGAGSYAFSLVIPPSSGGTGLANGTSGGILGFTGSTTIASSGLLAANGVLIGGGAGATPSSIAVCTNGQLIIGVTSSPPACQSASGDIASISAAGLFTIANSAITVAKQANAAAFSLEGNFTGSSAAPQFSTIGALTTKASPASGDLILISDSSASGALKQATVSSIAAAGSVASVGGLTGAIGVANGIEVSGSNIQVSAAFRTVPTVQKFLSGSGTYTPAANVQWIRVRMAGGGSGGSGSGTSGNTAGGAGGNSTFNTTTTAPGAAAPANTATGGIGGAAGANCDVTIAGANGQTPDGTIANPPGAQGASGFFGGGGVPGIPSSQAGGAAPANTGGGGGGAGSGTGVSAASAGGAGAYCEKIFTAGSYAYAVGAAGASGATGVTGSSGGLGGSGIVIVEEYYN